MSCPRVVVITRATAYERLLVRHGTREQARFYLKTRQQHLEPLIDRHEIFHRALRTVHEAIPIDWRRARVKGEDIDRFLFEPNDLVVVVGGNGLVANTAKYLDNHSLIGINANPKFYDGILARHRPEDCLKLLKRARHRRGPYQFRSMVEAQLDDGQRLLALNEIFIGQRSHRSARYRIRWAGQEESQSSSGVLVTTGTGATGWAGSIFEKRVCDVSLPEPTEPRLVFFVREPTSSIKTQTSIREGSLGASDELQLSSRVDRGGVIFGDGVEGDGLEFNWGQTVRLRLAKQQLCLVT